MIHVDDITGLLAATPTHGVHTWARAADMTRDEAIAWFAFALDGAHEITGSYAINIVESDTLIAGESIVIATTGNGPMGETHAKFLLAALHPTVGYHAALQEIVMLRARVAELESCARVAELED